MHFSFAGECVLVPEHLLDSSSTSKTTAKQPGGGDLKQNKFHRKADVTAVEPWPSVATPAPFSSLLRSRDPLSTCRNCCAGLLSCGNCCAGFPQASPMHPKSPSTPRPGAASMVAVAWHEASSLSSWQRVSCSSFICSSFTWTSTSFLLGPKEIWLQHLRQSRRTQTKTRKHTHDT